MPYICNNRQALARATVRHRWRTAVGLVAALCTDGRFLSLDLWKEPVGAPARCALSGVSGRQTMRALPRGGPDLV
ncbi:hypothetical protein GCM10010199_36100 [Dactylosporangium roseum]